jgi:hypothetical protein
MTKEEITSQKRAVNKEDLEEALIDNFIKLQKVMTNLSLRFDELSTNITKLLQLFEISAKNFAEKIDSGEIDQTKSQVDKELVEKINILLDQNKLIAKGIMLIEDKVRVKDTSNSQMQQQSPDSQMRGPERGPGPGGPMGGGMFKPNKTLPRY